MYLYISLDTKSAAKWAARSGAAGGMAGARLGTGLADPGCCGPFTFFFLAKKLAQQVHFAFRISYFAFLWPKVCCGVLHLLRLRLRLRLRRLTVNWGRLVCAHSNPLRWLSRFASLLLACCISFVVKFNVRWQFSICKWAGNGFSLWFVFIFLFFTAYFHTHTHAHEAEYPLYLGSCACILIYFKSIGNTNQWVYI